MTGNTKKEKEKIADTRLQESNNKNEQRKQSKQKN